MEPSTALRYLSQPPLAVVEAAPGSWHPFANQLRSVFTVTPPELDTELFPASHMQPILCFRRGLPVLFDPT